MKQNKIALRLCLFVDLMFIILFNNFFMVEYKYFVLFSYQCFQQ